MEKLLDRDTISFQTEGRLLQELGLRLVATPEVALVELIKNAYDADAPSCIVRLENRDETLVIADDGHGMTLEDFKMKWMRIATSSKLGEETSPKFHRPLTGAKGIGRFAVRYLGDRLDLESVARDSKRKCVTRLKATFDWPKLDSADDISKVGVAYSLSQVSDTTPIGTTLTVRDLRSTADFARSTELRDRVLQIVSPLQALERGRFARGSKGNKDPGFSLVLPGKDAREDVDLAKLVLDNYWGRLTVELNGKDLEFRVWLPGLKRPKELVVQVTTDISNGFVADIRFFPRRAGVFGREKGTSGKRAWEWVHKNSGVKIVDHGFHVRPYGFDDDDWLQLDRSGARNLRDWITQIAKKHFPLTKVEKADAGANPSLYLAYNRQLVGAVFVETRRNLGAKDQIDLVSAMDREGFLENSAFRQLCEYVRAGLEFLAREDKAELDRRAEEEAKEAARAAREEIRSAIAYIESSPTLSTADKARIVKQYRDLADVVDQQEEYSAQSRRGLLTMGLLGVVAGFMTHESKAIVHDLEEAIGQVRALAWKDPKLSRTVANLDTRLESFRGYLDYSRLFVQNVRVQKDQSLSASGQVRHVLERFKAFADERGIEVANEISSKVMTPPLPVTAYSGVLLNLYTNALKAVALLRSGVRKPRIEFRAWNEKSKHIVEVADNGVGIPPNMRKRIWEPLYTTTSDIGNPLGSGMGLGLTLVKQVVAEFGGSISLTREPPPGFTTCFRVEFPNR